MSVQSGQKPRAIEKTCVCGRRFVHGGGRGQARRYCSKDCAAIYADKARKARASSLVASCSVEGCDNLANRVRAGLCEKHYGRLRRNGHTGTAAREKSLLHASGYVMLPSNGHPLGSSNGLVYEHRKVLFDAIGDGPHGCHWCGLRLNCWRSIVVDHLDEDKANNSVENLVASCNTCNRLRGSFVGLLDRMDPARLEQVLHLARRHVEAARAI